MVMQQKYQELRSYDHDIFYRVTQNTKEDLILLTQKVYGYKDMNDESAKSSMQPIVSAELIERL